MGKAENAPTPWKLICTVPATDPDLLAREFRLRFQPLNALESLHPMFLKLRELELWRMNI